MFKIIEKQKDVFIIEEKVLFFWRPIQIHSYAGSVDRMFNSFQEAEGFVSKLAKQRQAQKQADAEAKVFVPKVYFFTADGERFGALDE